MGEESEQLCPQCGGIHEPGNCEKGRQQEPEKGGDFENAERSDFFVQKKGKEALGVQISNGAFVRAMEIIAEFDLSEVVVYETLKEAIISGFLPSRRDGGVQNSIKILEKFVIPDEIVLSKEVQDVAKVGLVSCLKKHEIDLVLEIKDKFKISEVVFQEVVKTVFICFLEGCSIGFYMDFFNKLIDQLPKSIIQSIEIQDVAKAQLIGYLERGSFGSAFTIISRILSAPIIQSGEVKEAVRAGIISAMERKDEYNTLLFIDRLQSESIIQPSEVQEVAKTLLIKRLSEGDINGALHIIESFNLPEIVILSVEVQAAVKVGIICRLKGRDYQEVHRIINEFKPPESIIQSREVHEVAKAKIITLLSDGIGGNADYIINQLNLPESIVQSAIKTVLINCLSHGDIDNVIKIIPRLSVSSESFAIDACRHDNVLGPIITGFKLTEFKTAVDFVRKHSEFIIWLNKHKKKCVIGFEDLDLDLGLNLEELNSLKETGFDLKKVKRGAKDEDTRFREMFEKLRDLSGLGLGWENEQNISGHFQNGAQKFGYKKMFQYIGREGLSRHDALHNFNKILELLAASGLKPEQFYGQILDQARMDDGHYETGAAHHELNSLANNINLNIQETVAKAQKYGDIEKMQALVQDLGAPEQVFASWKNLKKYGELCNLLGRTEILDQLQELKKSGKMKLYKFVETLAFHPNIDMKAVFQFWRDPAEFLDLKDAHDAAKVHDRKKPSNYTHIPNLDLTAIDLRDAQVDGDLDKLQAFRTMEIVYELPQSGEVAGERETGLLVLMKEALGSYRDKKEGKAKDPKKLFSQLQRLFKETDLKFQDYLAGKIQIDAKLESQARELVENEKIGYVKKPAGEIYRYRAKINLKSDPDGVVAGNDTACCMPFGSGKNNIYTFNPVCSLFTIQQERADGAWRTVAQSVLTKDKDIKKNIAEVMKQMNDPEKPPIGSVLSEDVLNQGESVLACDNVELTPNVKGHKLTEAQVELIYRDFMAEYLARYAKMDNLSTDQVVIGQGYSDSLTHLPQIPNTYAPSAPVGYSDKTHEKVYQLIPKLAEGIKKQVIENDLPGGKKEELVTGQKGVSYLTFEDTLPVAFIEGKAYHDNQTLIQYLHNMENALIAKDINNTAKGRPNMSLKHAGEDGKIHGYMLAYEGRMDKDEGKEGEEGEPIIYVSDIASDLKHPGTGGALMRAFLEQYRQNYVSKGNFVPIYAQAREKTSYAIIKSKLKKYGEEVGLELEMEEIGAYQEGDDTMHQIIIRVKV